MRILPRARGATLRLARRRRLAAVVGAALALPAAWIEWSGRYGAWWVEGLALVVGATGLALMWTAATGVRGDWIEEGPDTGPRAGG
jgi:hypothetical protein